MTTTITLPTAAANIGAPGNASILDAQHTRIYKYHPPAAWAFENLCRGVIYFRSPQDFNDPYDCRIPPVLHDLTDRQLARILKGKRDLGLLQIPDCNAMSKTELVGKINEKLGEMQKALSQECGIACFSKSSNNMPMWSHYADGGKGFCLEFQTNIRRHLGLDVLYSDVKYPVKFPTSYGLVVALAKSQPSLVAALAKNQPSLKHDELLFSQFLLTRKYKEWEYEQEARMIRRQVGETNYPPEALKAIYLGTEATEGTKALVRMIHKARYRRHTKLLYGHHIGDERRVEFVDACPRTFCGQNGK